MHGLSVDLLESERGHETEIGRVVVLEAFNIHRKTLQNSGMRHVYILYHIGAKVVEKNERKSAGSNELADYLTTKRIEFSYSTGKLGL